MARRNDWQAITRRQRAIRDWEARFFAAQDADDIAAERQARAVLETAAVDDLRWLDESEYDPSRESAVIRDWHPEADW